MSGVFSILSTWLGQRRDIPGWQRATRLLQVAVTLVLIYWIAISLDARSLDTLRRLDAWTLTFAVLLFSSAQLFGGMRLMITIGAPQLTLRGAVVTTWIGFFAANFLPSTVGGDVVRALRLKAAGVSLSHAAGALMLDRLINLAVVIAIAMLTAGSVLAEIALAPALGPTMAWIGAVLVFVIGVGVALRNRIPRFKALIGVARPAAGLARRPVALLLAVITSFLSVGVAILAQWLVARRLGMNIGLAELAGAICIVTLIVLVPVSLNGAGLQEGSFVVILVQAGVDFDVALVFALISRVLIVTASVIGGLMFAWERLRPRVETARN